MVQFVLIQIYTIFHRTYKTETAIRYTLAESLNLTGVVAFDAVDVPGSGNLGYLGAGWRARDERHGGSRMLHR